MSKTLIIIVLVAVILVIAAAASYYFFIWRGQDTGDSEPQVEEGVVFHTGEVFVTNLRNSELLLKTDVFISVPNRNLSILQDNVQLVRDRIIRVLRSFTEEDILNENLQDMVRDRIKSDLQNTLNIDKILDVYFTEFVLQ
jgi:flagellar basal body-associated protein FliL